MITDQGTYRIKGLFHDGHRTCLEIRVGLLRPWSLWFSRDDVVREKIQVGESLTIGFKSGEAGETGQPDSVVYIKAPSGQNLLQAPATV